MVMFTMRAQNQIEPLDILNPFSCTRVHPGTVEEMLPRSSPSAIPLPPSTSCRAMTGHTLNVLGGPGVSNRGRRQLVCQDWLTTSA